jgi:hypothetical protein
VDCLPHRLAPTGSAELSTVLITALFRLTRDF